MELEAEVEFDIGSGAQFVYQALMPETGERYQRTSADLWVEGECLYLRVRAQDVVSMRAALNGWLRLVKVAWEMGDAF